MILIPRIYLLLRPQTDIPHERNNDPIEILELLLLILFSKTPLTNWILEDCISSVAMLEPQNITLPMRERTAMETSEKMSLTLFFSKSLKKVLCAESSEDFVDFLISFLTFPLGSVPKVVDGNSVACLDNIYNSVGDLNAHGCFKSKEAKRYAPLPQISSTDELVITFLSSASFIDKLNVPLADIDEVTVEVGEEEAKHILRAALVSNTALTNIFSRTCLDRLECQNLGDDLETLKL